MPTIAPRMPRSDEKLSKKSMANEFMSPALN
jgi:hypothetical protein